MERAREHGPTGPGDHAEPPGETGAALELLVHGVGGATPGKMLGDPRTVRITGDDTAAVFRRAGDADAESRPGAHRGGPVPEAYVWCNLTSGNGSRALWLVLLPFMVVNLAHWMRPTARGSTRTVRLYGLLVRLAALTLTVLLVAAVCEVALDLTAWQCAGTRACAGRHSWLGFLSPESSAGGWWSRPGRRLALAALLPAGLTGLLWYLSHRTWSAYESQRPLPRRPEPDEETVRTALSRPGFWYGRRLVAGCAPPTPPRACSRSRRRSAPRRPASTAGPVAPPCSTSWAVSWRRAWSRAPWPWCGSSAAAAAASGAPTRRSTGTSYGCCRSPPSSCSPAPWCTPAGSARAGNRPAGCRGTPPSAPSPWPRVQWSSPSPWWPACCTAPTPTPGRRCAAWADPPSRCWPARWAA